MYSVVLFEDAFFGGPAGMTQGDVDRMVRHELRESYRKAFAAFREREANAQPRPDPAPPPASGVEAAV